MPRTETKVTITKTDIEDWICEYLARKGAKPIEHLLKKADGPMVAQTTKRKPRTKSTFMWNVRGGNVSVTIEATGMTDEEMAEVIKRPCFICGQSLHESEPFLPVVTPANVQPLRRAKKPGVPLDPGMLPPGADVGALAKVPSGDPLELAMKRRKMPGEKIELPEEEEQED